MIRDLLTVRREAERFLRGAFLGPATLPATERLARLRPRPEDFAAVFGAYADLARAHYDPMWERVTLGDVSPRPGQTEVDVWAAECATLATDNPISAHFPGAMRSVASRFAPDQVFVHYRFRTPGDALGFSLTGLAPMPDGRFVLFPKPWRVFEAAA